MRRFAMILSVPSTCSCSAVKFRLTDMHSDQCFRLPLQNLSNVTPEATSPVESANLLGTPGSSMSTNTVKLVGNASTSPSVAEVEVSFPTFPLHPVPADAVDAPASDSTNRLEPSETHPLSIEVNPAVTPSQNLSDCAQTERRFSQQPTQHLLPPTRKDTDSLILKSQGRKLTKPHVKLSHLVTDRIQPHFDALFGLTPPFVSSIYGNNHNQNNNVRTERPLLLSLHCSVIRNSYIVTLIAMMAWAVAYRSWLSFILLLSACILWISPNSRSACLYASPLIVLYAIVLILIQYVYCMNLTGDELPQEVTPDGLQFSELGMQKWPNPVGALGLQITFLVSFWLTLRLFVNERSERWLNSRSTVRANPNSSRAVQSLEEISVPEPTSSHAHRPTASAVGAWFGTGFPFGNVDNSAYRRFTELLRAFCVKYWIVVCCLSMLFISTQQPVVIFRIFYMVMLIYFMFTFQINTTSSFENPRWIGLVKVTNFNHYIMPMGALMTVCVCWHAIACRQRQFYNDARHERPRDGIVFPQVTIDSFDKDLRNVIKFAINYGFYKFGLEILFRLFTASYLLLVLLGQFGDCAGHWGDLDHPILFGLYDIEFHLLVDGTECHAAQTCQSDQVLECHYRLQFLRDLGQVQSASDRLCVLCHGAYLINQKLMSGIREQAKREQYSLEKIREKLDAIQRRQAALGRNTANITEHYVMLRSGDYYLFEGDPEQDDDYPFIDEASRDSKKRKDTVSSLPVTATAKPTVSTGFTRGRALSVPQDIRSPVRTPSRSAAASDELLPRVTDSSALARQAGLRNRSVAGVLSHLDQHVVELLSNYTDPYSTVSSRHQENDDKNNNLRPLNSNLAATIDAENAHALGRVLGHRRLRSHPEYLRRQFGASACPQPPGVLQPASAEMPHYTLRPVHTFPTQLVEESVSKTSNKKPDSCRKPGKASADSLVRRKPHQTHRRILSASAAMTPSTSRVGSTKQTLDPLGVRLAQSSKRSPIGLAVNPLYQFNSSGKTIGPVSFESGLKNISTDPQTERKSSLPSEDTENLRRVHRASCQPDSAPVLSSPGRARFVDPSDRQIPIMDRTVEPSEEDDGQEADWDSEGLEDEDDDFDDANPAASSGSHLNPLQLLNRAMEFGACSAVRQYRRSLLAQPISRARLRVTSAVPSSNSAGSSQKIRHSSRYSADRGSLIESQLIPSECFPVDPVRHASLQHFSELGFPDVSGQSHGLSAHQSGLTVPLDHAVQQSYINQSHRGRIVHGLKRAKLSSLASVENEEDPSESMFNQAFETLSSSDEVPANQPMRFRRVPSDSASFEGPFPTHQAGVSSVDPRELRCVPLHSRVPLISKAPKHVRTEQRYQALKAPVSQSQEADVQQRFVIRQRSSQRPYLQRGLSSDASLSSADYHPGDEDNKELTKDELDATVRANQREEGCWSKFKATCLIAYMFLISSMDSLIRFLNGLTKQYRRIRRTIELEKRLVKRHVINNSQREEQSPLDIEAAVISIVSPEHDHSAGRNMLDYPSPAADHFLDGQGTLVAVGQSLEQLDALDRHHHQRAKAFRRSRSRAFLFLIALGNLAIVYSEWFCYLLLIVNHMRCSAILSLPYPLMVFLWGMLSVPRPTKTFWIFLITYTETGMGDNAFEFIKSNRIPLPFISMLLVQFVFIIIDRGLFLRKQVSGKFIFQILHVLLIHGWLFFILPHITKSRFTNGIAPQLLYLIKCVYFSLSAYQIRSGYPLRILGNFLTKNYNYINLVLFKGYLIIPFLYELRNVMDWMWTNSALSLYHWMELEDIYCKIFVLKCWRRSEIAYPTPRGVNRPAGKKALVGGLLLAFFFLCFWGPMTLSSFIGVTFDFNPPMLCTFSLSFGGFPPTFEFASREGNILKIDENVLSDFTRCHEKDLETVGFLNNFESNDIRYITIDGFSGNIWAITPPSYEALLMKLADPKSDLLIHFHMKCRRQTKEIQTSQTSVEDIFSRKLELVEKQQLLQVLNGTSTASPYRSAALEYGLLHSEAPIHTFALDAVTLNAVMPRYVLLRKDRLRAAFARLGVRETYVNVSFVIHRDPVTPQSWWELKERVTAPLSDPCFERLRTPTLGTSGSAVKVLSIVTFNERVSDSLFGKVFSNYGIIGMYAAYIFLANRLLRTIYSNISYVICLEELPHVDRILNLCNEVYLVREYKLLRLEEQLVAKLFFLYRSSETMIKWTRHPKHIVEKFTELSEANSAPSQPQQLLPAMSQNSGTASALFPDVRGQSGSNRYPDPDILLSPRSVPLSSRTMNARNVTMAQSPHNLQTEPLSVRPRHARIPR
ncbi:piezo-type mechanosensitive ion channel component 1/2 [Paragonimus westermani]|uniref:Piezo-type mechanosensitive ion channel component 1/2 n=1 Tax=Paragonimus westermani TaxID=34504 RepID=A0A5J4P3D6_9TREM|nr:piezo-type mechanosensitive ion channel component 1/2 [Paragonimus westermani]